MAMARTQTLVQLDDRRLARLDERAAAKGISRSEVIRRAVDSYLADDTASSIDAAIVAAYEQIPPPENADTLTAMLAIASIEADPW